MTYAEQSGDAIRVVGICGSLRSTSYTRMAVQLALQGAHESGAQTQLIDLREYELPFCDGKQTAATQMHDVRRLQNEVRQAHGIILGTPEYHGSFSGVLKNALDLLGFPEFEGKMVGLVGVSGGQLGAINALTSLRAVGRSLHAWVVPEQVSIPVARNVFTPTGELIDPMLAQRVKEVGRQVARFAFLHTSEQVQGFLRAWESAPHNPGGSEHV